MKISMVLAAGNPHVADLSAALIAVGHEVTVHSSDALETTSADGREPYLGDYVDALRAEWDSAPPDLVHAHHWRPGLAAVLAAQRAGLPVVQSLHGCGRRTDVGRLLGRESALVLASCEQEMLDLAAAGVPRSRISVVARGVDVDLFKPHGPAFARSGLRRVVTVVDPSSDSGVAGLVAVLPRLKDAELVVAGPMPPAAANALRGRARRLGVEERVRLLGPVARADMPALLRSADLVACVPDRASWDVWPLEAMACGVPVVVTDVGGLTDAVIDGVTGLVVPVGDLKQLIRRLRLLLDDDTLRTSLSIAAVDRVDARHTWPDVARGVDRLYRLLLDPPQPVRPRSSRRSAGGAPAAAQTDENCTT
ncbi:glycosyltransferase [Lentzea sp. DG1S-22]|uniref:glycosyltransferase n=1 Tax=Lentzea sp. DG1S-22 TaxID=3108822 RepID=UPI002E76F789|nr:glycosyltransferase [Lentzea sp. DG1S-22]WVH81738.1 glycosyltransferase [Lentzea sp. DG1S-22]